MVFFHLHVIYICTICAPKQDNAVQYVDKPEVTGTVQGEPNSTGDFEEVKFMT